MAKTPVAATAATMTILAATNSVPLPELRNRGGSKSQFDFDALEVGGSIGVIGRTAASLSSTVYNANKKYKQNVVDENGNVVYKKTTAKNAEGADVSILTSTPETVATRRFIVVDVDAKTDPEKVDGARIFRVK